VLNFVAMKVHVCFAADFRRVAVKSPPQSVGEVTDTIISQSDEHWSVLGTYEGPRLQLSQQVSEKVDVRQRRQIRRLVEDSKFNGGDEISNQSQLLQLM